MEVVFLKITWKPLSLKTSNTFKGLVIRQFFIQKIIREKRDAEAEKLVEVISLHF